MTYTRNPIPYILYPIPYILCYLSLYYIPYTIYRIPYTLNIKPHTIYPYTLYSIPYTLYPIPYTLYPKPYTLNPNPETLHPPLNFRDYSRPQSPRWRSATWCACWQTRPPRTPLLWRKRSDPRPGPHVARVHPLSAWPYFDICRPLTLHSEP